MVYSKILLIESTKPSKSVIKDQFGIKLALQQCLNLLITLDQKLTASLNLAEAIK